MTHLRWRPAVAAVLLALGVQSAWAQDKTPGTPPAAASPRWIKECQPFVPFGFGMGFPVAVPARPSCEGCCPPAACAPAQERASTCAQAAPRPVKIVTAPCEFMFGQGVGGQVVAVAAEGCNACEQGCQPCRVALLLKPLVDVLTNVWPSPTPVLTASGPGYAVPNVVPAPRVFSMHTRYPCGPKPQAVTCCDPRVIKVIKHGVGADLDIAIQTCNPANCQPGTAVPAFAIVPPCEVVRQTGVQVHAKPVPCWACPTPAKVVTGPWKNAVERPVATEGSCCSERPAANAVVACSAAEVVRPLQPLWSLRVVGEGCAARLQMQGGCGICVAGRELVFTTAGRSFLEVCAAGQQVHVCSQHFRAAADCVTHTGKGDAIVLEGHVRLQYCQGDNHTEIAADRVVVHLSDGRVEVQPGARSAAPVKEGQQQGVFSFWLGFCK